jgi:hypothetical protein
MHPLIEEEMADLVYIIQFQVKTKDMVAVAVVESIYPLRV